MGIYIKSVEIPTSCIVCHFGLDGWCHIIGEESFVVADGRRIDCPIVSVPPHGALIDSSGEIGVNVTMMPSGKCSVDLIAPTIIPADEPPKEET